MPTGSANFVGKAVLSNTNPGGTETVVSDLNLAANFAGSSVQATISNATSTFVSTTNTSVTSTSGSLTGAGIISGSAFTIPSLTGNLTVTGQTNTNGGPATVTSGTVLATTIGSTTANFVGTDATGLYGAGTTTASTGGQSATNQYEIYGTKQ
jgi:hypothetical protein